MRLEVEIKSLSLNDLDAVPVILADWLSSEEVLYYTKQIRENLLDSDGSKFDSHYYGAFFKGKLIGLAGRRSLLPKLLPYASSLKPAELNMLYVGQNYRGGQGVGTSLVDYVATQAKEAGYSELIVRSALKFEDTGWGFYDHLNFQRIAKLLTPNSEVEFQVWSKPI